MDTRPRANILLVDDEPANLLALEAILGELGQNLVRTRSGEEALRRLLDGDYAVILLDVRMPGLTGLETAKLIRGRPKTRDTPIIFLTAYESDELPVREAYHLGAVDYLVKPLVPEILRAKVAWFVQFFQKSEDLRRAERAQAERSEQLEREARALERLASPPTAATAQAFGVLPLRESHPELFAELSRRYAQLLALALEQRQYKVAHHVSEGLREMGDRLGFARAGPRDVVDLYGAAVKDKTAGATPQKARAYAEEGRLMTLELMGHLVSYYRAASLGSGQGPVRTPPPPDAANEGLP